MPFWKWLIFIVFIVLVLWLSLFFFCALKISDISEIELWLNENGKIKKPKCVFLFGLSNILNLDYNELLKYRFASFYRKIDAKIGCFDFILTKEVSRFARDTLDSIQFVKSIFDNKNSILEENTKTSFESVETLRKTIENIISINDDSVLSIVSSLFEKIIVETNHEKNGNKKAVLHCQLKIEGDKRYNLPLKELSLLFKSNESFCRTKW